MEKVNEYKAYFYIAQYYSPEPYLKDNRFIKQLSHRIGDKVLVITGFPNYPFGKVYDGYKNRLVSKKLEDGVATVRLLTFAYHGKSLFKRLMNYLVFALGASFYILFKGKSQSLYYIQQSSPLVGLIGLVIKIFKPKSKIILDVQDVFPANIQASGFIRSSWVLSVLEKIIRYYYQLFDGFVFVSKGVRNEIKPLIRDGKAIQTVYNWSISEGDEVVKSNFTLEKNPDKINIVYAGNIGASQALLKIADAIIKASNRSNVVFHFLGSGTELDDLKGLLKDTSSRFYGRVSPSDAFEGMNQADALFLHLRDGKGYENIIPSKLQSYFLIAKPIVGGLKGEPKKLLDESGFGVSFLPEDQKGLIEALELLDSSMDRFKSNASTEYYQQFSREKGLRKIIQLIHEC